MNILHKIKSIILFDTYGAIASANFIICLISGVFLAVPYDVNNPYDSISLILIANPAAELFRNLHYWSAQIFLVFSLLHLWEHLKLKSEKEQSRGIWFRLTISILAIFLVMITGFILKGDADSVQARRIISNLFERIPLIGGLFSYGLFGAEDSYQLTYIHHIATTSIFLVIIIIEHAKTLWVKASTFIISLSVIILLSFILNAPLHDNLSPVIKGPWYFIGLQEVLHWFSNPSLIVGLLVLLLLMIYLIRSFQDRTAKILKKVIYYFFWIYILLTIIGFFFRGENWKWQNPWEDEAIHQYEYFRFGSGFLNKESFTLKNEAIPSVQNRREACIICHSGLQGFSPSHDPIAIGCTSCHLGDPFSLHKESAHNNMILIPGNLTDAGKTCGTVDCHPGIPERVNQSLMTTNSGIVSVDRFVFGESESPDILSHIKEIGHTAADKHLRDLCAKCHLGNEKKETGPIDQISRGGGCTACHLNYSKAGKDQHFAYIRNKREELLPSIHPSLDLNISSDHCFGCHSRSGRISTNYMGWHETLLEEVDAPGKENYKVFEDKRVYEFVSEDVHHQKGMDCIDCHNSYELMGDGNSYLHEENAVKIRCDDCHFNNTPNTIKFTEFDTESKKIFELREFAHQVQEIIKGKVSSVALLNTYIENDRAYLIGKNSKAIHPLNSPAEICTKDAVHESLTCSACHTAWAPQCIGCHNQFDPEANGYDLLENKFVKGEWVEYVGKFFADPPTLGMRTGEENQVEPAIPGMIMTIDKSSFDKYHEEEKEISFHRLYAPVSPHTTSIKGRDCKSCHSNPLAIGYGRGDLVYTVEDPNGKWTFSPSFAKNKYDGLAEDAWIGFLAEPNGILSTRTDFRPFTLAEQKKILTVGACLHCHDENSPIIMNSLDQAFQEYLQTISAECILPDWKE
jgi:hypothetical protein